MLIRKDINKTKVDRVDETLRKTIIKYGLPQKGQIKSGRSSFSELVLIALYNEFGTKKIPARPFMSTAYFDNRREIRELKKKLLKKIYTLEITVEEANKKLGRFMVGKVRKKIIDIRTPPNAPSTIKRKGADNPLIDTGQLKNSINFIVEQ